MPPITEDNIKQLKKDYVNILSELLDEGWKLAPAKKEAQFRSLANYEEILENIHKSGVCKGDALNEMKGVVDSLEKVEIVEEEQLTLSFDDLEDNLLEEFLGEYSSEEYIKIRKVLSVSDLGKLASVTKYGSWENTPKDIKTSLLFHLGMDVYKGGWWTKDGLHTNIGNKRMEGKYILSEERTDKGWINQIVEGRNVASYEAQVIGKGKDTLMYNSIAWQLGEWDDR